MYSRGFLDISYISQNLFNDIIVLIAEWVKVASLVNFIKVPCTHNCSLILFGACQEKKFLKDDRHVCNQLRLFVHHC